MTAVRYISFSELGSQSNEAGRLFTETPQPVALFHIID